MHNEIIQVKHSYFHYRRIGNFFKNYFDHIMESENEPHKTHIKHIDTRAFLV